MMMPNILNLIIVIIGYCIIGTFSEVRLLCPRPQVPNSNVIQGPCDPRGLTGPIGEMTDVSPGPLTVRWEETVYRKGSPSRIALKSRSQNITCVLLDQIPHNENQFTNKGPDCNVNDYPIGGCRRSTTSVTVLIPDIQCNDCYLQLISVDTSTLSAGDKPCSLDDPSSTCNVYYSCANIKIWSTVIGRASSLQCEPYPANLDGPWPYIPTATFGVSSDFARLFFSKNVIELRGNTLIYDVRPIGVDPLDIVPNTEGLYDVATGFIARAFQRRSENLLIFQGSIDLTGSFLKDRLLNNQLAIGLRSIQNGLVIFPLERNSSMFAESMYVPLSAQYSTRGILRSVEPAFTQPDVFYTTPFKQYGPCALPSKSLTAALAVEGGSALVGLVRATATEYSLYITAVIPPPNDLSVNSSLALAFTRTFTRAFTFTSRLNVSRKLILPSMPKFVVDGPEDMADFLTLSLGDLPETVEATVSSGNQNRQMSGSLIGGTWADILDENGQITGLVTVNLLTGSDLDTKLLVVNFTTAPQLGGLFGPALPGRVGARVFLPTSNVRLTQVANASWLVQSTLTLDGARSVRHLWSGVHYIDIKRNPQTPARSVSGQLSKLDIYACQNVNNVACLVSELATSVPTGGRIAPTSAFVAFFPKGTDQVEFSIVIRGLQSGDAVTAIQLRNDSSGVHTDVTPTFTPSAVETGALEGEGSFSMPGSGPTALNSNNIRMVVFTSRFPNGEIAGLLPTTGPQQQPARNRTEAVTTSPDIPAVYTIDDFSLECGQRDSGPMRIVLNKPGLTPAAVYAENHFSSCSFVNFGSTWILENARRTDCGIQTVSGANWLAYEVVVLIQRQALIQTVADPRFSLSCNFTGGDAQISVVTGSLTVLSKPFERKQETVRGNVDQIYRLSVVNNTDFVTPVSRAMLGDRIALLVTMQGTDPDEQSLRVRRCVVSNTRQTEVLLLDNYCPVLGSVIDGDTGFVTTGTSTVLSGLQVFKIQDSPDGIVTFTCVVEPCNSLLACHGNNCGSQAIRRKRSESDSPQLRIAVQFRVVDSPDLHPNPNADSEFQSSTQTGSTKLTLLLVIAVVSSLLLISCVITILALCHLRKVKSRKSVSD